MTARRRLPLAALAVAVVAALVPAAPAAGQPAWVALAPPYDDAQADHACGGLVSSCSSGAEADAPTGAFTLAAEVASPAEGTLPGDPFSGAYASAEFTALHHLVSPAAAVGYRVTVHIGSAEAAVEDYGYGEANLWVSAEHSAGCDGCWDSRSVLVVDLDRPERVNEDVVVQLSIARPDGSAIPPGDVAIGVELDARAALGCLFVCLNGRASVRAEGVATSVEGAITPPEGEQPPANDDLMDATSVGSVPFVVDGRTHGATIEPGEPRRCGATGSTVWFRFTAPKGRGYVAHLRADFDGVLAVYRDAGPAGLEQVGCADDTAQRERSIVGFQATAGESYLLQVGGYLASQGAYRLTLNEGDWTRVGVPLIGRVEGGTDGDHARACLTSRFVASFCEGTDGAAG